MIIGAAKVELEITDGLTLKDKRHVVKSLLDRMRSRFNVSCAEVERQDSRRLATLGVAAVSSSEGFVREVLQKVQDLIESEPRATMLGCEVEVM